MYADRNAKGHLRPGSMAAAVAINAALITAVMTSAPGLWTSPSRPFTAYNVPLDSPPPPPEPQPAPAEAKIRTAPEPLPIAPKPMIEPRFSPPVEITATGEPQPLPSGIPGGTGTTEAMPFDPPKPAPVLVEASPDPRGMREFQPDYPASERRLGHEGAVTVRVLIGVDGRVKAVEGVRSANEAFLDATRRQALSKWRFRPATRDGVPYESWRVMTVRFVLEG